MEAWACVQGNTVYMYSVRLCTRVSQDEEGFSMKMVDLCNGNQGLCVDDILYRYSYWTNFIVVQHGIGLVHVQGFACVHIVVL